MAGGVAVVAATADRFKSCSASRECRMGAMFEEDPAGFPPQLREQYYRGQKASRQRHHQYSAIPVCSLCLGRVRHGNPTVDEAVTVMLL